MSKRVLIGVSGGLLLVVGLVIGVIVGPSLQALAAGAHPTAAKTTPTATGYCQLYEQTVMKDLGVSQSKLENANKDALQQVIDQMSADGKITPAQKSQAEQALSKYASNPCVALQAAAQQKQAQGASASQSQAVSSARSDLLAAVAGAMNTSSSALQSELSAGKTVSQIISEKGASKSAVDAAYMKAAQAELAKAVSAGQLTQAQADMAATFIQQAVSSGHYPLLDKNDSFSGMLPASMTSGQ